MGEVVGYLKVVECVVVVDIADKVDEVEAGEHICGEPRAISEDCREEQREQRVPQSGRAKYPHSTHVLVKGGQRLPEAIEWGSELSFCQEIGFRSIGNQVVRQLARFAQHSRRNYTQPARYYSHNLLIVATHSRAAFPFYNSLPHHRQGLGIRFHIRRNNHQPSLGGRPPIPSFPRKQESTRLIRPQIVMPVHWELRIKNWVVFRLGVRCFVV